MKLPFLFFIAVLIFSSSCENNGYSFNSKAAPPSYNVWDALVKKYVDRQGWVDYKNFKNDLPKLQNYLDILSANPPADNWSRNEKLAYWINAYNAFTVKLILDHYPIESIKDIGPTISIPTINDVFTKEYIPIGDEELSLNNIEHDILRKMNEPRIHFAINCASVSCPKLRNEAYFPEKLEQQLQDQTLYFINHSGRNRITFDKAEVSKIFNWFRGDFTKDGSLRDFLNKYADSKINAGTEIDYLDYNWKLNSIENKGKY